MSSPAYLAPLPLTPPLPGAYFERAMQLNAHVRSGHTWLPFKLHLCIIRSLDRFMPRKGNLEGTR